VASYAVPYRNYLKRVELKNRCADLAELRLE
jgi:hypothetical protein